MATGPSPRVRQEFRKYLTNTVAAEGEPAALGKSATGPVYYTDYDDVEHKNRVWFRKGSNKEIVGVARADNQGLPDVPNLPIRVARRFGSNWVVDWQRENAAVPTGGGGGTAGEPQEVLLNALDFRDFNGVPVFVDYNGLLGPVWRFDSTTGLVSVHAMTPVPHACTQIRVSTYYHMRTNFSGVNSLEIVVGSMEADETATSFIHGYDTTVETESVAPPPDDDTLGVWTVTLDLNNVLSAGDLLAILFKRWGTSGATTNTGVLNFAGMRIEFVDATVGGGATSTASGVHKFSPAEMLAAQNASETSVNSLATPAIAIPDSGATPTINVAFLAEKTSATLDIDIYAVTASGSGNVVLDADAYSGATDGTGTPTDNNGFVTDGTFAADGNIRKFTLTVAFTTQPDLTPGDYCSARIQRLVASGSDTLAADLHVLMIVVTENGDG